MTELMGKITQLESNVDQKAKLFDGGVKKMVGSGEKLMKAFKGNWLVTWFLWSSCWLSWSCSRRL